MNPKVKYKRRIPDLAGRCDDCGKPIKKGKGVFIGFKYFGIDEVLEGMYGSDCAKKYKVEKGE